MNRSIFHILVRVILLSTMFISSLPPYPASAAHYNSKEEGQDSEGELTVQVLSESPLDEFPPEEAFVLLFSEPMQIESSPQPLTITPSLEGQLSWDEDAKYLTFIAEGGFASNQIYVISLDLQLTSRSGKQFVEPQTWVIHTLAGPSMTSKSPDTIAISDRFPIIRLTFDRIMDPESVIDALNVEPKIEMDFGWGGMDFFIRSLTELDPNGEYHFTLSQDAKDIHGLPLISPYAWTYTLEPVIRSVSYPTHEKRTSFFSVEFNYGIQWESLSGNLSIEPEISGQWIQEKEDGTIIKFIPDGIFQSDVLYTIRFNGTPLDLRGSELPTPDPISFRSPPAIRWTSPDDGDIGDPPRDIIVNFDRLMDKYATEAALNFQPPLEGQFYWENYPYEEDEDSYGESSTDIPEDTRMGAAMIFVPNPESFSWGTEYAGTLDIGAKDAEGNPILQEPYQWSFQTGVPEEAYDGRFGYWGANIQILDTDGPRAVQYELGDIDQRNIEFSLHPLTLPQFLDRFKTSANREHWRNPPKINLEGISEIHYWKGQTPEIREGVGEIRIPYNIPAGIYVLNLIDGDFDFVVDQLFIVLSKNTLAVKQADGQIVTWVTDINGGSRQGVLVQIYDAEGNIIDNGYTDVIGVYRSRFSTDAIPYLVMAKDGDDLTISGLDTNWAEGQSFWNWNRRTQTHDPLDYGINIYTDRPIYRPGQSIFFKSIVRQDDDAIISLPYQGTPVSVRIKDPRNNMVQSFELSTNSFGTVHDEFKLSDGAMVGDYTIEVESLGKLVIQEFKVQDYRKPDIQAILETDADHYVVGEDIQLTLRADYLFDEPVDDASVDLWMYDLVPSNWWYWGNEEEDDEYIWTPGSKVHDGLLAINNGFLEYSIPAEIDDYGRTISYRSNLEESIVAIEAAIDDGSGQSISTYKIVKIFSSNIELQLDLGDYFKLPGQSFTVNAYAFTISKDPLIAYPLQLSISRYGTETHQFDEEILNTNLITGEDGMASHLVSLEETGVYMFKLIGTDDRGNETYYKHWVYVYEENDPWVSDLTEEIRILVDKTTYASGETAHLVIESTFDGEALLTVQRGTTRRVMQVFLTSPVTNVDLEILETDSPNIFVSINAFKDEVSTISELFPIEEYWSIQSLVESQLHHDTIELTVPPTDEGLTISITPDKETFAPREEATFSIEVTDQRGNPVSAELSLALVDEAIFSLSEDLSTPLYDAFYSPRQNGVKTYNSMGARRWIHMHQGGGGGGGPSLPGTPRSDFPDTAAWIPILQTDSTGRAELTLSLPDTLTTWRLTAKAVTKDTKVGETEVKITTKQNVVILPLVPRTLTEGDTITLSAVVQNYDESEREFDVLLMNTSFEVLDPALQSTSIKPGESEKVSWKVRAEKPGEAVITMIADDGDIGDAVQVTLPVHSRSIPELITQTGDFRDQFSTTIMIPEESLSQSWVQIELNRSIAESLLAGLEYLTHFPYGCVEQTMSRALPNAIVARAFHQLGVSTQTELADLSEKINAGLQQLYGYQHIDGGWGWWYDDASHAYQTAWVVYGLAMTAEAGYEVDPNVIERGADWLSDNLDKMDDQVKAYALYSMATAGYGDLSETLTLATKTDDLDTFSIAALALALQELEEHETALQLVDAFTRTAIVEADYIHWSIPHSNDEYDRRTMASEIRDTALALSALVKITPNHPYESRIVRWLMDQRGSHGWGDTHQNSYAILALTDHLLASGYAEDTTSFIVLFNGTEIASGSLGPQTPTTEIQISGENLLPGQNSIELIQRGAGQIYYVINHWIYRDEVDVNQAGNVTIERNYNFLTDEDPTSAPYIGQLVKVELKVTLPRNGSFIILEDMLPGGFEALNESLSITSHELTIWGEPRFAWRDNGYNHKEVHADRVSFFFTELEEGTHRFTYLARINHKGEFIALPAQAWAMYDNTLWGRSSSTTIIIDD